MLEVGWRSVVPRVNSLFHTSPQQFVNYSSDFPVSSTGSMEVFAQVSCDFRYPPVSLILGEAVCPVTSFFCQIRRIIDFHFD